MCIQVPKEDRTKVSKFRLFIPVIPEAAGQDLRSDRVRQTKTGREQANIQQVTNQGHAVRVNKELKHR